jgi:hypothetical protein
MSLSDIAMLLGFIGIYDLRVQVDELKVRAWAESLDKDIPLDEAKRIVSAHYANSDAAINPSHINKGWRLRLLAEKERKRSEAIGKELERTAQQAAPPEVAQKYLLEIRNILKGKNAEVEEGPGEVASDT